MIPIRDNIPSRTIPIVNYAVIAANAAAFVFELNLGPELEPFLYRWGLVPALWSDPLLANRVALLDRAQQLFTSMFLHGGWMHILSNLWMLYIFGDNVEDRLGHLRYLFFYLATGLAAGGLHLATHWSSPLPTIGASGAIAGVLGAYFVLFPWARVVTLVPIFIFLHKIEIPAFLFLGFWFFSQLYNGAMSLGASFGGIAWWAHIGGFVAGMYLAGSLLPRPRRRS